MRYGKAVFSDGHEAYLVYTDSPGWAFRALFPTPEKALEWREQDFPVLRRSEWQAVDLAKASEEPVHILADMDFPGTPALWFYTTASRAKMVITGPTSREDSELLRDRGEVIYSKEFFDSWSEELPNNANIERYETLTHARKAFIDDIVTWWPKVEFMTLGERGERNVFDDEPRFVSMARLIQNPRLANRRGSQPRGSTQEVAAMVVDWWDNISQFDGDRNIFDEQPSFIERAKRLQKKAPSIGPEP